MFSYYSPWIHHSYQFIPWYHQVYWHSTVHSPSTVSMLITGRNEVLAKVIFSQACVCPQGGGACSKFWGGACSKFAGGCLLQIFGGVPAPNFQGGVCSKFSGGVPAPNFRGVPAPNFRGGLLQIFGEGVWSPIFGIRSMFSRYASYWNAFLFIERSLPRIQFTRWSNEKKILH